jgi:predicted DNA-binding transcriptional regulator AlpA
MGYRHAEPKLTEAMRQDAVRRWLAGESRYALAMELQISPQTVVLWAQKRATPEELAQHVELVKSLRRRRKQLADYPPSPAPERLVQRAQEIQRDYILAKDATKRLNITRHDLYRQIKEGYFPGAFQIGGKYGIWLIPVESVEAFAKARGLTTE